MMRRVGKDSEDPVTLSYAALRDVERVRMRVTAKVMAAFALLGLSLTPLLGGDVFAKTLFMVSMAGAALTLGAMLFLRNVDGRAYSPAWVGAGMVSLTVANASAVYYVGTFSLAAMTAALGVYIFSLGANERWSTVLYTAVAAPHGLLAASIMSGLLADRGLVQAAGLPWIDQVALQGCAQAVYALALMAGVKSRRKLERAFGELESAARHIAQRDALINEAKRDLERAVRVGGEGRFTDHCVGSFRLGNVIGRGGMGEVYDAVHIDTHEPAAVKLLQREAIANPDVLVRFAREAKAAAALNSPNVVRVLEVADEDAPVPYLAMERLRGEDLAGMLRREHQLSPRELLDLVRQVSNGLEEARRMGVIHRDIKPQNLFLARGESGTSLWKVLDFGVSKLVGHGSLTQSQLIGTPEYMAPEQAAGDPLDHRTDLYSLTAVLYRCLVSRAPYAESSLMVLIHKLVNKMPTRPSSLARVSPDLEAFLAIGLAKSPAQRFESAAELTQAFELALEGRLTASLRSRAQRIVEQTPWSDP
ncbi:MAG TPA: serine/threonine-protein kinase [Polyangiales bacterium]